MHLLQECPNGDFLKSPAPEMLCSPKMGMAWQVKEEGITWEDPLGSLQGFCRHWGITSWGVFDCSGGEEIPLQKGIPTKLSDHYTSHLKCKSSLVALSHADAPQLPAGSTGWPTALGGGGDWPTASSRWWWNRMKATMLHDSFRYGMKQRRSPIIQSCWESCSLPTADCCSPCRASLHGKKEGISKV